MCALEGWRGGKKTQIFQHSTPTCLHIILWRQRIPRSLEEGWWLAPESNDQTEVCDRKQQRDLTWTARNHNLRPLGLKPPYLLPETSNLWNGFIVLASSSSDGLELDRESGTFIGKTGCKLNCKQLWSLPQRLTRKKTTRHKKEKPWCYILPFVLLWQPAF